MKRTTIFAAAPLALGVALTGGMASAQTMGFADIDVNGDGVLEMSELQSAFGQDNALVALETYDMDGDGMVVIAEAREAQTINSVIDDGTVANEEFGEDGQVDDLNNMASDNMSQDGDTASAEAETDTSADINVN
jgi:Ca2+-binding EF-hand superfamily protein